LTSYLITTTDRSSWPDSGHLVFLGTFCLPDDPESLLGQYTYEIADTSINSDDKLHYFRISLSLHSTISRNLATALNKFHVVDESERYWSIITGVWLRSFIDLVISRAVVVARIRKQHTQIELIASTAKKTARAAKNFLEFHAFTKSSDWNSILISDIWTTCTTIETCTTSRSTQSFVVPALKTSSSGTQYVLSATYLPRLKEVALTLMLGSLPRRINIVNPPSQQCDEISRQEFDFDTKPDGDFEKILIELIRLYIPTAFLEGFKELQRLIRLMKFPDNPKTIFTANRHLYDDVFNVWVARATSQGSFLVLGQHGGNYGISRYPTASERHELTVADKYITWGWSSEPPTTPGVALTTIGKKHKNHSKGSKIVLVADHLWAMPRSIWSDIAESSHYLTHLTKIAQSMDTKCKDELHVRLHHSQNDTGHPLLEWWKREAPQTTVDTGDTDFNLLLQQAKLVIIAHNGTTFLETFTLGIPTLITWKSNWTEIRDDAKPFFERFTDVGIFHEDPESLTRHLSQIYDDIDGWWESREVTDARQSFCQHFSRTSKRPLSLLRRIITQQHLPINSEVS
jgi:putative transferase (TIGR04331 family)